jgi:hypothetical protein
MAKLDLCVDSPSITPLDEARIEAERAKRATRLVDPSKTALAILKRKETAARKRILALANGNGSKRASRSADALRRLNVTEQELMAAPEISPLLKRAGGGLKGVISALRMAQGDKLITKFLKRYDSIPIGDRERLPIEAIALAARVDLTHLLGSILLALQKQSVDLSKIIAVTSLPRITAARVKYGLMPSGERDRAALDTSFGFLPSRKVATIIDQAIFNSGRSATNKRGNVQDHEGEEDGFDEDNPDLDRIFPPARIMQEKLARIKALAAERPRSEEKG